VRQLVHAYLEVGDAIEILCLDKPGEAFLKTIPCPVHALGPSFIGRYGFSPRLWRWLHKNAHRFDGIVMNGIWTFPDIAVRSAARRAQTPYGIFAHGALDPWFNRTYPFKHLKKILYWPFQYAVLRDSRAVFFTSETERDLAKASFSPNKWNSVVVPYGINDPEDRRKQRQQPLRVEEERRQQRRTTPADQVEAFYRMVPVLRGRRYLLFLARIHEKKGCDLLLRAFAKAAASVPDVDLVDQDTLEGTERLLCRWFNLPEGERDAMAVRAKASFLKRYAMNRAAVAINRLFNTRGTGIEAL
jgi:glycosyltransferase involved in cell wall biosynthesis